MILLHEIRLGLQEDPQQALGQALQALGCQGEGAAKAKLHKISVDARRGRPGFVCSVAVRLQDEAREATLAAACKDAKLVQLTLPKPQPGKQALPGPVVVCGLGPAGLFAALELAKAGYAPLVLERGPAMEGRRKAVQAFEKTGVLNPEANLQFGEGGAGTFSDGKLTTRIKDPLCALVLHRLLEAGAPEEIAWQAKPHIGTDLLQGVFVRLRQQLQALGGQVLFDTKLENLRLQNGRISAVQAGGAWQGCGALVLASGHSARGV